jgi:hypothetical protein
VELAYLPPETLDLIKKPLPKKRLLSQFDNTVNCKRGKKNPLVVEWVV